MNYFLTRGNYDVVVINSANDFETVGVIKLVIMSTRSFDEAVIFRRNRF